MTDHFNPDPGQQGERVPWRQAEPSAGPRARVGGPRAQSLGFMGSAPRLHACPFSPALPLSHLCTCGATGDLVADNVLRLNRRPNDRESGCREAPQAGRVHLDPLPLPLLTSNQLPVLTR